MQQTKTLTIKQGEKPPKDTPQILKNLFAKPSFWQELDDSYYEKYPEEWENNPLFLASKPFFGEILNDNAKAYARKRQTDETIKDEAIWRAGREIWKVGRVYNVCSDTSNGAETTIGKIELVKILEEKGEDILSFRTVS